MAASQRARQLARHGLDCTRAGRWSSALQEVWTVFLPSCPRDLWPSTGVLIESRLESYGNRGDVRSVLGTWELDRNGLASFLKARREAFECDIRYVQLVGDWVFAALHLAGSLTQHVLGVDEIEHSVEHAPASGRLDVRSEATRSRTGRAR